MNVSTGINEHETGWVKTFAIVGKFVITRKLRQRKGKEKRLQTDKVKMQNEVVSSRLHLDSDQVK